MSISLRRSSRRWRRVTVPEAGLFGLDEARGSRGGANRLARQDEPELASRSRLAVEFDSPAERPCRALRDREAETGAAARAVTRLVDAVEAVEDALAVLRCDADARVADGEDEVPAGAPAAELDLAARGGVADRVCQQVAEHGLQQPPVGDRRQRFRLDRQRDAGHAGSGLEPPASPRQSSPMSRRSAMPSKARPNRTNSSGPTAPMRALRSPSATRSAAAIACSIGSRTVRATSVAVMTAEPITSRTTAASTVTTSVDSRAVSFACATTTARPPGKRADAAAVRSLARPGPP